MTTTTPIKRGTARRLGLVLPRVITMRIEPDLSAFKAWGLSVENIRSPLEVLGGKSIAEYFPWAGSGVDTHG